ncbi:MAG: tRNA (adenosine(37)-N6)-threonylcarbamoyltransferase complex ATPase subunit type 1 TsaE [Clostridia bacterium]|nr:tRNA (adenosine(37)-N6)-threonylcarbamoyltransferase complex ATPase subunit type 1 TsaE [Clostridia bacterium]
MMERTFVSASPEETRAFAASLAPLLPENCFIALFGKMGMGKTEFVRGLCSALVPGARLSSPTYTVLNVYSSGKIKVNHFDMYRISDEDSLESTGFYDVIRNGVTVCEWSENVPFALPDKYLAVRFTAPSGSSRRIELKTIGAETYADLGY